MSDSKKTLRICGKGHKYYKSSSCPVCPACEKEHVAKEVFLQELSAPARRALENAGVTSLQQLSGLTEKDVLALHGMGPGSLPKLRKALVSEGLAFRVA